MVPALTDALPFDPTKFISDPEIGLLVLMLVGAIFGAYKKWWVPGWLYDKSESRADSLQKTIDAMAPIMKEQNETLREIENDILRSGGRK